MKSKSSNQVTGTARQLAKYCSAASPRLAMIAAGITGNRTDAEDIVQQAIAIAIEKDSHFDSQSHFIGWLAGVVRNCALNYRRKTVRRGTLPTDPTILHSVPTDTDTDLPIDPKTGQIKPLQDSFDDRVHAALQEISPNARSCLLLRTVEELSYREISELMNIPEGTAMNLVHRSKKKLRDILTDEQKDGSTSDGERK